MRNKSFLILCLLVLLMGSALSAEESASETDPMACAFIGQDLHLQSGELISHQVDTAGHILVFQDGFSMSVGAHQFSSDSAVVWLSPQFAGRPRGATTKLRDCDRVDNRATVYLQGEVSTKQAKGAKATDLIQTVVEERQAMVVCFDVSGEVFVTAGTRRTADPRALEIYAEAFAALQAAGAGPAVLEAALLSPRTQVDQTGPESPVEEAFKPQEAGPRFRYPINLSPVGEATLKTAWDDVAKTGTVVGRFYIWQKQDEKGGLLELQADNAVIFSSEERLRAGQDKSTIDDTLASGALKAIYLSGDVVMTEGQRTIRADEIYYDLERKKALAINAVMRNFDATEGIPIYVRAAKLRQLAENKFAAEDITLTTSEFYLPQISANASSVIITDTTTIDEQQGTASRTSYDAQMRDVRFKTYDKTFFYWPSLRGNLQRPDIPLKSAHVGYDSTWGASVETRWYLARLLGLQEPEGTDSTLALDYFGKRGPGGGIETNYAGDDYFGRILGYVIHDTGEDRLGRNVARKDIEPPRELRGRFRWQHRHFLPYNWQLTTELSYASDQNFIESFYRGEFNVGKEQETLVHLNRIEDNWGLSFLGKVRINDFVNKLEELPTAEFHWTGQSFFDDRFTFYSDTQLSRLRQRYASSNRTPGMQQFFSFATTRNEIDMPMAVGKAKVVPFVAGTIAYEDGLGFYRELDGGMTRHPEDELWFGETGVRASYQPFWKVFPDVRSELWDLNRLRHVIEPYLTAVAYNQDKSVIEQRDTVNVGISQRLQTKRGSDENQRTVDWMHLNMDVTWINNSGDASAGADKFIWNRPLIPPINRYSMIIPQQDRRGSNIFGPRRNYVGADYTWRLSDTTAVLSDMNYDMQSGVVQQFNVGFSHLRWPNLSYYIGSRYLRRIDNNFGEKGSNALTFAVTYVLDPRYTVVFSQQFDFDYGATIRSDITLVRQYHRLYWGLTYSADESLDTQAIAFSIWPQGVPDLAIGPRRYTELGGSAGY